MFNFQPNTQEFYFDQREQQVYESSKLFGRLVWYLKASVVTDDKIFGEAIARDFLVENAYQFYGFRDNDTQYTGMETFGGFGFVPQYNDIIYIPTLWFKDNNFEPIENDLVYYEEDNMLFEITKVNTLTEQYGGDVINNRRFTYKLYLKLYSLADDNFTGFETTDIAEIEGLDDVSLNNLNDSLIQDIANENIVDTTRENPFGDLD